MTEQSQPLTQAQDHDRRLGRLEGIAEQTTQAIVDLRQDMRELRGEIRSSIRWVIGIQIASLLAIVGLLVGILNKLPG
ncbi:MAG: hypothetical protein F4Y91_17060 [Gemmatimonadetes bacterium]|nr:hypothetical protein [Gemmatimonadota bacterium]MXY83714.1 hypothetical protein [Gemmatimonadota bacterium]MYB68304.1 hypothetical protein [Gemmatimonadota bacterium]